MPADTLEATVARFNGFAAGGKDENYHGDHSLPNPNLDTIERGPYYAIRIEAGDLGAKGGLLTNAHGQVLRPDGAVIPGLYATGNASAAVMGNEYAGAEATIVPAMVFGYLEMEHATKGPST